MTLPLVLLLLAACPSAQEPLPQAPTGVAEDAAYSVALDRTWLIVGNDLTPGHYEAGWTLDSPGEQAFAVWLGDQQVGAGIGPVASGTFDVSDLPAGEHALLFALDGADTAFARRTFVRSHPLYIVTSVDWDRADTIDDELGFMDSLHDDHPALVLTQFVGPYTFTDPGVAPDRRDTLVDWLLANEAAFGDEIGLHIHPYCNFVDTTSVPCLTEPSFAYEDGDGSGYTVFCSAYSRAGFEELLLAADAIFEGEGLGKPVTFRAGGWTANTAVLQALADAGYSADTSANNWALMEEWQGAMDGGLYDWNAENWAAIGSTSQPYYPDVDAPDGPGPSPISILEVPDNGIMADYAEAEEMIAVLQANWDGGALAEPKVVSIGFHNRTQSFNFSFRGRVRGMLDHVDEHLADDDAGPLIYERLDGMPRVWPTP